MPNNVQLLQGEKEEDKIGQSEKDQTHSRILVKIPCYHWQHMLFEKYYCIGLQS